MLKKLKLWFIRRQFNKLKTPSNAEKSLDDELISTEKEYLESLREFNKQEKIIAAQQRIKEMRYKTKELKNKLNSDDEEEYDNEEEYDDEPKDDFFNDVIKDLIKDNIGKVIPSLSRSPSVVSDNHPPTLSTGNNTIVNFAKNKLSDMNDDELLSLAEKFLKKDKK